MPKLLERFVMNSPFVSESVKMFATVLLLAIVCVTTAESTSERNNKVTIDNPVDNDFLSNKLVCYDG